MFIYPRIKALISYLEPNSKDDFQDIDAVLEFLGLM